MSKRKAKGNLYDSMAKEKEYKTELVPIDRYIKVKMSKEEKESYLPTIRMICPEINQKEDIDENEVETLNKNNDKSYHCKDADEEDESVERIKKYEYIKRMTQRKLKRINNLKKKSDQIPQLGHYFPNYSLVEKKAPSVVFKKRSERKRGTDNKQTLNLSPMQNDDKEYSCRKKKHTSDINIKAPSNSVSKDKDKVKLKRQTYITNIIESETSIRHIRQLSTLLTHKKHIKNKASRISIKKRSVSIKSKEKEKEKDLSNVLSFKNMIGRDIKIKHKSNSNIPTLGTYSPKYTCIDRDNNTIAFNGEFSYAVYKKNMIQKAIHDYNKSKEFILMKILQDSALSDESSLHRCSHKNLKIKDSLF